jgi:hypothetical protein
MIHSYTISLILNTRRNYGVSRCDLKLKPKPSGITALDLLFRVNNNEELVEFLIVDSNEGRLA